MFSTPGTADYCGKPSLDPRLFGSTIRTLASGMFVKKGGAPIDDEPDNVGTVRASDIERR